MKKIRKLENQILLFSSKKILRRKLEINFRRIVNRIVLNFSQLRINLKVDEKIFQISIRLKRIYI